MAAPSPGRELHQLDPQVWKACAGTAVRIPAVGSAVYYFPQGHAEQSSSPPDFSALPRCRSYSLCRVAAVGFLANRDTDEVFARFLLDPRPTPPPRPPPTAATAELPPSRAETDEDEDGDVVCFAKILTPSDANNGGGFSVPRFCADSIFPPLDFAADPPLQTLSIFDVQGNVWNFRHIYRGTPRRHLLTTGWSKFVNNKKLVAGDSVVFIRNKAGELFVGVRRAARSRGNTLDYLRSETGAMVKLEPKEVGAGEKFSRDVKKGRVPPESVVEAVRMAEMNRPFEVLYYPKAGSPDFVVEAEVVEASRRVPWTAGMRVKMPVETEDSSTMTWFQGMVSGTAVQDPGLWPGSPWRMLQVALDEPKVLQHVKSVNPWQVELASTSFHIQAPYPTIKRLKVSPTSELPSNVEANMYFPVTGFSSMMMGDVPPSLINYSKFPAGMQGARHSSCESSLSSLPHKNTHQLFSGNSSGNKTPGKLNDVSTELNIGNTSQTDSSSPHSQSTSIQCYGTEFFGTAIGVSSREKKSSFRLFGQIIQMNQHFNSDAGDKQKEVEGSGQSIDFSFPYQPKQLLTGLDIHSGRVSA